MGKLQIYSDFIIAPAPSPIHVIEKMVNFQFKFKSLVNACHFVITMKITRLKKNLYIYDIYNNNKYNKNNDKRTKEEWLNPIPMLL